MSVCVFWLNEMGQPCVHKWEDAEFGPALKSCETLRNDGMVHVCISTELASSVGKPGVSAVINGELEPGVKYEWSKKHRGDGPRSS